MKQITMEVDGDKIRVTPNWGEIYKKHASINKRQPRVVSGELSGVTLDAIIMNEDDELIGIRVHKNTYTTIDGLPSISKKRYIMSLYSTDAIDLSDDYSLCPLTNLDASEIYIHTVYEEGRISNILTEISEAMHSVYIGLLND